MSYAAKCDRCGATAEVDGRQAWNGELPAGWVCIDWEGGTDFCGECVTSFENWLKEQKPDPASVQVTKGNEGGRVTYRVEDQEVEGTKESRYVELWIEGYRQEHAILRAIGGEFRYWGRDQWRRSLVIEVDA